MFKHLVVALIATLCIFQDVQLTAYTASLEECGKTDGITASGTKATQGRTIAADHLPFGTLVEIDGHLYTVEDRFGGDYTNKIDIYFDSYEDALEFGIKEQIVRVYAKEEDTTKYE